ncbi:MAG: hypothetical protein ABIH28_03765 [archaeon]
MEKSELKLSNKLFYTIILSLSFIIAMGIMYALDTSDSGTQSLQGLRGYIGADGPAGPPGPQGETGPQGIRGDIGETGATGPQGPQGLLGEAGPQGPRGYIGADGATGPQGEVGPQGLLGEAGPQGPRGYIGATGPQGPQGIKGETGATGATGPQGPPGTTSYDAHTVDGKYVVEIIGCPNYVNISPTCYDMENWAYLARPQPWCDGRTGVPFCYGSDHDENCGWYHEYACDVPSGEFKLSLTPPKE